MGEVGCPQRAAWAQPRNETQLDQKRIDASLVVLNPMGVGHTNIIPCPGKFGCKVVECTEMEANSLLQLLQIWNLLAPYSSGNFKTLRRGVLYLGVLHLAENFIDLKVTILLAFHHEKFFTIVEDNFTVILCLWFIEV